jgi:hypothetical protein
MLFEEVSDLVSERRNNVTPHLCFFRFSIRVSCDRTIKVWQHQRELPLVALWRRSLLGVLHLMHLQLPRAGISFSSIAPIKALFWSAVINGVVAAPVMTVMMLMTANKSIMGRFEIHGYLKYVGWIATAVMAAASAVMFISAFLGGAA